MADLVCAGAMLRCSMGAAPSMLQCVNTFLDIKGIPVATIVDHLPMSNILPFGLCSAPTNPAVIAASGAPAPCVPATVQPWAPGAAARVREIPALCASDRLLCTWLGVIEVQSTGAPIKVG